MKILLLMMWLVILFASCYDKRTNSTAQIEATERPDSAMSSIPVDTIKKGDCHDWLSNVDSTLSTGDYLKYIRNNGRIKIVWGNKNFKRALKNYYDCDGASSWVPYMRWATTEYIGLHYGCGSPCWGAIILPLNATDSVVTREFDFGVDAEKNQLVYLDDKELVVENWKTGKKFPTMIKVTCESAFQGYCIDSVNLRNNKLYVKWKEIIGDNDDGREVIETVKVKF